MKSQRRAWHGKISSDGEAAEGVQGEARVLLVGERKKTSINEQLSLHLTELKNKYKLPVRLHKLDMHEAQFSINVPQRYKTEPLI